MVKLSTSPTFSSITSNKGTAPVTGAAKFMSNTKQTQVRIVAITKDGPSIYGVGDDNMVYFWDPSNATWLRYTSAYSDDLDETHGGAR